MAKQAWTIETHPPCCLQDRLIDDGGEVGGDGIELRAKDAPLSLTVHPVRVVRAGAIREGRELDHIKQHAAVRIAVQAEIAHRHGTNGLAVVTVGKGGKTGAMVLSALGLGLEGHLEGDFDGGGAVVSKEHLAEVSSEKAVGGVWAPRARRVTVGGIKQPLAQADDGRVGGVGQDDVFETLSLLGESGPKMRVAVTE